MKLMVFVPPPSGCYGPTDATLDWFWLNNIDPDLCVTTVSSQLTWTNPCEISYAVSYYYEMYWDAPAPDTLVYTSGTYTGTLVPGSTVLTDSVGPTTIEPVGVTYGYLKLYVTWPDSTITTYTSFSDLIEQCA